jgi:hypothetical protein
MSGNGLLSFLSPVGSLLFGKPKAKAQAPIQTPQRNDAAEAAAKRDVVSRRKGVAANLILGAGGAESSTGGKSTLGS